MSISLFFKYKVLTVAFSMIRGIMFFYMTLSSISLKIPKGEVILTVGRGIDQ